MNNPIANNFIIDPIDVGGNALITGGWIHSKNICLVSIISRGKNITSRLDLSKGKFIDNVPGTRSLEAIHKLIAQIRYEQSLRFFK